MNKLTKKSPPEEIRAFFEYVIKAAVGNDPFPAKLEMFNEKLYDRKEEAVRTLKSLFTEGVDYQILRKSAENSKTGRATLTYQMKLHCMEFLVARKEVEVFKIYSSALHQLAREERNPDLLVDRYYKTYQRKGKDDKWIGKRLKGKVTRNDFTRTLAAHNVSGEGYRNCTNAIYDPLFGGTAAVVRKKLGIGEKENPRDNMSDLQLAAVELSELMAKQKIEQRNLIGNASCELASKQASMNVAQALIKNTQNPL